MANQRLPMREIREVLRLKYVCGLSARQIAQGSSVGRTAVRDYLRRAKKAGVGWPLPEGLSAEKLEALLFPPSLAPPAAERAAPDCEGIYNELRDHKKLNLTLSQLWLEYKDDHPDGYQYTQFCEYYKRWRKKLDYCMRQEHRAGEKLFVDYCDGLSIVNPKTGELIATQLFVAVWGASNFTYAEASLSQTLPCWIGSHVRAFDYFGCVPHAVVPDNLKSGVSKPCFYEPDINPTYAELARHYGTTVLPARPAKPRDKAKVEAGVLVAQRWLLAVLRKEIFHSVAELNAAIRELLNGRLNARLLRKMKRSRRDLFDSLDRPAALPLPERHYEYAEWLKASVNIDYHIEVDSHYYSVPYPLLRERLDVRLTASTVESFLKGERVAAHPRSHAKFGFTTLDEHRPPAHRKHAEWTPSRIVAWAEKTGPCTGALVAAILAAKTFPEHGYRACLGILRLGKRCGDDRLEAACRRALKYKTCSYKSVRAILAAKLDQVVEETAAEQTTLPFHGNIRGGEYYKH